MDVNLRLSQLHLNLLARITSSCPVSAIDHEHAHAPYIHAQMKSDLSYVHPAIPLPRQLKPASFRRPRTCSCKTRPRVSPICKADDDGRWFGVKPWFRRDENGDNENGDNDAVKEHKEDVVIPEAESNGRPSGSGRSAIGAEKGNKSEGGFRWPWRKDENATEEKTSTNVRTASHSDSKPGSFGRRRVGEQGNDSEVEKVSLQERWQRIVDVIAPGWKHKDHVDDSEDAKEDSIKRKNGSNGPVFENENSRQEDKSVSTRKREEKQRNSVFELYKPPSKQSRKDVKEDESWFRVPWKKSPSEGTNEKVGNEFGRKAPASDAEEKQEQTAVQTQDHENRRSPEPENQVDIKLPPDAERQQEDDDVGAASEKSMEQKKRETAVALRSGKASPSPRGPFMDAFPVPQRDVAAIRLIFGSETFFATETLSAPGGLIFRGNLRGEPKATVAKLEQQLASRLGDKYTLCLAEGEEDLRPVVIVVPTARDKRPASPRQKFMALVLAMMTASTCLGRGLYAIVLKPNIHAVHGPFVRDRILYPLFGTAARASLSIATAIGLIIVISQVIQRMVGSRYKTRVAIPFLLPSYQLGSFGAVVQVASPTPSRAALFDIALSGAATLVILSMICLLLGLRMSTTFSNVIPVPMSLVSNSVVMGFLTQQVPDGKILIDYGRSLIGLHPLAVIGANSLTIAALNLLPIRQLDGGRIITALYGRRTAMHASRVTVLFLLLASSKSPYFIVFLAAITFGPWHQDRPSRNELTEPDGLRTIVGYLFMLLMIGVLLPFPACKFFGTF